MKEAAEGVWDGMHHFWFGLSTGMSFYCRKAKLCLTWFTPNKEKSSLIACKGLICSVFISLEQAFLVCLILSVTAFIYLFCSSMLIFIPLPDCCCFGSLPVCSCCRPDGCMGCTPQTRWCWAFADGNKWDRNTNEKWPKRRRGESPRQRKNNKETNERSWENAKIKKLEFMLVL